MAPISIHRNQTAHLHCGPGATTCFRPVAQGYPNGFVEPSNFNTLLAQTRYIPNNIPTGYVQAWHLDVQRELMKEHRSHHFVHRRARRAHLGVGRSEPGRPLPGNRQLPHPAGTPPHRGFTAIEESIPAGFLSYNALQVEARTPLSRGLYFLNSFTWSRAIDNASGHLDTPNNDNSRVNLANLAGERGESAYNQPLNNTTTVVWDMPFGHGRHWGANSNSIVNGVLGNWQLSAINTATSGQPVNLIYSISSTATVSSLLNYRPNVSGNPVTSQGQRVKTPTSVTNYLSSANVSIPDPAHPYGNAGRNTVRGYPYYQLDLGLHKGFRLWSETSMIDFRGEAFNALNQVNYTAPDSNRSNSSFGTITGYFPPRQLQLAAKIIF